MKLTKSKLKQIIEEELRKLPLEEKETPKIDSKDIQQAKKLANSKIGQSIFDQLEKNPRVQKALEKIMADQKISQQLSEEEVELGGAEGAATGALGTMGVASGLAMGGLYQSLLASAAGKVLVAAVGTTLAGSGLAIGALITPIAIGILIDKMAAKKRTTQEK